MSANHSMKKRNMGLVLIVDDLFKRSWLHERGIPERIYQRLSQYGKVLVHVHRPCTRFPNNEHKLFVHRGIRDRIKTLAASLMELNLSSLFRGRRFQKGVGYDETVQRLVSYAKSVSADYLVLVMDNNVAIFPEGIELALRAAEEGHADAVCCTKVDGIVPIVVSTNFLERWLKLDHAPDPRLLRDLPSLAHLGVIVDLDIANTGTFSGSVRCYPIDRREQQLLNYWEEHSEELRDALRRRPEVPGEGRDRLEKLLREYRSMIASGLEAYRIAGTLHDVDDLRRRIITTQKPLVDYFVIASHYGRFLQMYAGLNPKSRIVDIGCSWGYLGFAMANFLMREGVYTGIEVQKEAVEWAQERFGWLGENFRFIHLDIHNDYYNSGGSISRGHVRLPIEDNCADVVTASSVFSHMQQDGVLGYFKEFRRILAPGGIAAFSYIDSSFWGSNEEYLIGNKSLPDKLTVYSRSKIVELLGMAGLETAREPVNLFQFDRTDFQTWYFATPKR